MMSTLTDNISAERWTKLLYLMGLAPQDQSKIKSNFEEKSAEELSDAFSKSDSAFPPTSVEISNSTLSPAVLKDEYGVSDMPELPEDFLSTPDVPSESQAIKKPTNSAPGKVKSGAKKPKLDDPGQFGSSGEEYHLSDDGEFEEDIPEELTPERKTKVKRKGYTKSKPVIGIVY